jgi:ADP-ribose pyrophosphatase YjhB (NUDIX family)
VAIDLIIRDPDRRVLVRLRTNEPAKGKWFVPSGVVIKYERLADAFARIVKAEIGLEASIGDAKFIGVYEHLYDTNVFGEEGVGTHYVVLARELNLGHRAADCERWAAQRLSLDEAGSADFIFIRTLVLFSLRRGASPRTSPDCRSY